MIFDHILAVKAAKKNQSLIEWALPQCSNLCGDMPGLVHEHMFRLKIFAGPIGKRG